MVEEFKKQKIDILKVYHCPHKPEENCLCRKPKNGMILKSLNDFDIDLKNSWLIGDKKSDIDCAKNGKIENKILISKNEKNCEDFLVANSLFDSLKYIKE